MSFRRPLWILLTWLLACVATPQHGLAADPQDDQLLEVPLTIHVAVDGEEAVVDEARIRQSLARANQELRTHGVVLRVHAIERMPMPAGEHIDTSDERFDLARTAARDGTLHVFWVEGVKLTNPAKGDRRVSGLHWRYRGLQRDVWRREYVAIARNAPATTLVHEVGHAFGLRHVDDFDNLMCSCQRGRRPVFDEEQGQRLRRGARRFLARAEE